MTLTSEDPDLGAVMIDDGEEGETATKTVAAGSQVTIQAIAATFHAFSRWSDNDSNARRTITVNSDINLSASFSLGD